MSLHDKFIGSLLGLAVGDALGAAYEFRPRGSFTATDIVAAERYGLRPGQWTDDTSMAMCLAESLRECGFDARDQVARYLAWRDEGYWGANGRCVDIGTQTNAALTRHKLMDGYAVAVPIRSDGNGAIMRLCPVVLWAYPHRHIAEHAADLSAATTHPSRACRQSAEMLAAILVDELDGVHTGRAGIFWATAAGLRDVDIPAINGETWSTLRAAVWACAGARNFEDAVLRAVNLGGNTDTVGAVAGQIAGARWGASAIPRRWLDILDRRSEIEALADSFYEVAHRRIAAAPTPACAEGV